MGRLYERMALEFFLVKDKGNEKEVVFPPEGAFKPWDFKYDGVPYEVKSDRYGWRTNAMAIEFICSGKPSGITTTEAKDWFYFMMNPNTQQPVCGMRIPVKRLRKYIADKKPLIKTGGDNGASHFYIVPREDFNDCLLFGKPFTSSSCQIILE